MQSMKDYKFTFEKRMLDGKIVKGLPMSKDRK